MHAYNPLTQTVMRKGRSHFVEGAHVVLCSIHVVMNELQRTQAFAYGCFGWRDHDNEFASSY